MHKGEFGSYENSKDLTQGYKNFFMLNSGEHEIYLAYKS